MSKWPEMWPVVRKMKRMQGDQPMMREAVRRTEEMLLNIAAGLESPPVPHLLVSRKHGVAERTPFDKRTPTGQRKLVMAFVMETMARDAMAAHRGWSMRNTEAERQAKKPGPRAPETPEQAQARIARVNNALLRDLGVKP